MSKILEIFSERHKKGQIYRNVPIKTDDNVHPLNYVYPDTEDSVTNDVVFDRGSLSLTRDIDRFSKFEDTHIGARFLDKQILLQRSNVFQYTRKYREDNLKDHIDPMEHKPRHVISLLHRKVAYSLPGEFTFVTGDIGKLQTETADNLVKSSGPVFLRLSSKEGMMNTDGLTILDFWAARVRRDVANRINDFLAPVSDPVGNFREEIFGSTSSMRPENEIGYLEQIFNANRMLQRPEGGRYGQHYLSLTSQDYSGTYRELFGGIGESAAPGFVDNIQSLRADEFTVINFSIDRQFQSIVHSISNKIHNKVRSVVHNAVKRTGFNRLSNWVANQTGGRIRLPNVARGLSNYVTQFLPRSQDITLLRHLRRWAISIDNVIEKVNAYGSSFRPVEWDASNIRARYVNNSRALSEAKKTVEMGADNLNKQRDARYNSYLESLKQYKKEDKVPSIGFAKTGNTTQVDGQDVFKAHNLEYAKALARDRPEEATQHVGYYKDHMQESNPSIYRAHDSIFDSDSIDVIMKVNGREEVEEVRFRAFIQDVVETVTPTYNENKYIGRYETSYTYDRITRDVGFSLTLHAFSLGERDVVMQKMAYLTSLAYPESSEGYLTPLVTELSIGKLYVKQPCIVQTLTHTIENDASWDIDQQTPMTILVNMGVRLLDKRLYTHEGLKSDLFTLYLKDAWEDWTVDNKSETKSILGSAATTISRFASWLGG